MLRDNSALHAAIVLTLTILNDRLGFTMYRDNPSALIRGSADGTDWLLSGLSINVGILEDYFQNIVVGPTIGAIDGLYPGSNTFGVSTVSDFILPDTTRSASHEGVCTVFAGLGFSRRRNEKLMTRQSQQWRISAELQ